LHGSPILTLDLGTSVTKAVVWDGGGPLAIGRHPLTTSHPDVGRAEQDPAWWWRSVLAACAAARAAAPAAFGAVGAIAFSAARQTFVPVAADGRPLGPGILWSDRRAGAEAEALGLAAGGADAVRQRTGMGLDAASVAAKIAWLHAREPDRLGAARWLLSPRDLTVWQMTGTVATDTTLASASGLYDRSGCPVAELVGAAADRLPEVIASDAVAGEVTTSAAGELGVVAGIPVVIGAGDRQCELLGAGASATRPMVSWGTTANVSLPVAAWPTPVPAGPVVTRAALGGWQLECGVSAAGSLLAWLASLTGTEPGPLVDEAAASPPGARGVLALPWLGGARAPWWRDGAGAAFVGLGPAHVRADLARAGIESVAWEVARGLEVMTPLAGRALEGLALGGGSTLPLWVEILTAVTALPATRRRSGEAASAGAAIIAARGLGAPLGIDELDPVDGEVVPPTASVERYGALRPAAELAARAVISLADPALISPAGAGGPSLAEAAGPSPAESPGVSVTGR